MSFNYCQISDINLNQSLNNRSHIILPFNSACFQVITSSAHWVCLVRYWHQPQKGACHILHTVLHFLISILFKRKRRHTPDIIYTSHSWALLVLAKGHICFLKSLKQRSGVTDTCILWVCECACRCMWNIYMCVCVCVFFLFLQTKQSSNKFNLPPYLSLWGLPGNFLFQLLIIISHKHHIGKHFPQNYSYWQYLHWCVQTKNILITCKLRVRLF